MWYLAAVATPLVASLVAVLAKGRGACWWPLAAAPALAVAVRGPASTVDISWLLLGSSWALDERGALFLLFTSVVWFFATWFAAGYITTRRPSFYLALLLAMTGNFGLILAADMPTFYLCFALMSFASYGLVVHRRDRDSFRAGKVYLVLVVTGEVLIFSGMVGLAHTAGATAFDQLGSAWTAAPLGPWIIGALVLGFGIKAGALPLHVWLPLAHPAAPAPASAALSGAMIKAGLLGWLRFLPVGETAMPVWGDAFVLAGLAAALYAVPFGFFQVQPKTVLAYSSISKMGLMTACVGVAMRDPDQAALALGALGFFALDHALTKGALFLGTAIHPGQMNRRGARDWVYLGHLLPALSLAGFAGSGGMVAKTGLKKPLSAYGGLLPEDWLAPLLLCASWGAVLLVVRFLWVHFRQDPPHAPERAAFWAWGLQVLLVCTLPGLYLVHGQSKLVAKAFAPDALLNAAWPVLAAGGVALVLHRVGARALPVLPAGDILVLYAGFLSGCARTLRFLGRLACRIYPKAILASLHRAFVGMPWGEVFLRVEQGMGQPGVFGGLFLLVLAGFVLALLMF
jgi:formate hydrogenlyase subunit 3/multisubunit Na+/H+ antiporter MnhD subunit